MTTPSDVWLGLPAEVAARQARLRGLARARRMAISPAARPAIPRQRPAPAGERVPGACA